MITLVVVLVLLLVLSVYNLSKLKAKLKDRENVINDQVAKLGKNILVIDELERSIIDKDAVITKKEMMAEDLGNRLDMEIEDLKKNNRRLSNNLINSGNDIKVLKEQLKERNNVVEDLARANKDMAAKVEDLSKKNASLLSSCGGYKKSNNNLQEMIKELREDYNNNVRVYNELKDEYDKVVSELESLNADAKEDIISDIDGLFDEPKAYNEEGDTQGPEEEEAAPEKIEEEKVVKTPFFRKKKKKFGK